MAHLEVKPKSGIPWWVWLLIAIIAVALLLFFAKGCNSTDSAKGGADSTQTNRDTSSGQKPLAVTEPNWNAVDFNAPAGQDADITDEDVVISGNDQYTIYALGENVLFATDQNAVQASADSKLQQVAAALNKRFKNASIGVYGSTDSTGTAGHNKALGAERANAVKDWLVAKGNLDASNISVHSFGEKEPVASNASAAGRQKNRNVSIVAFPAAQE